MRSSAPPGFTPAPVLVFGSDTNAFLGVVRSLGRAGITVHAAGCSPEHAAGRSRYIAACHAIPEYVGSGTAWADRVAELCRAHDFSLLIPTSDSSLAQLDAHRGRFGQAARALPPPSALATLSDKTATRALAAQLGIPVPAGREVAPGSCAHAVVEALGLPVIAKTPRSYTPGASRQKTPVILCESTAALAEQLRAGESLLVERFIPGFCRGVSVLVRDGEVLQAFQHRRLRQHHRTGPSSWRRSEPLHPELLAAVRDLMRATAFSGVAMCEFRFTDDASAWYLLEVNPRFWGSLQLAMDAGADYPAEQYRMVADGLIPASRFDFLPGVEKYSAWGEYDALSERWSDGEPAILRLGALARFVLRLADPAHFDSYAPDDPRPFYAVRRAIGARLWRRLRKGLSA